LNKHFTTALTAFTLGALSTTAAAQASVTVYGILDLYYVHEQGSNPAGSVNSIDAGAASSAGSRLGFKGREDLGGGLAAIFTAEMGFGPDTGAFDGTGVGFGRQAFVGLQGNFGVLKFGRQYNPLFTGGSKYDPFSGAYEGFYNRLISLGAGKRLNNTVIYGTPDNLGGFNAEASYSLGEVPGDNSQGRAIGLQVGYANGPFITNFIYNNSNNIPVAGASIVNMKNIGIGAAYNFKVAKLSALYQTNKSDASIASLDTRDYLLGITVPFGADKLMASYISHKNKAIGNADTTQIALGYSYALSKRTTLYTSYARISNDAAASIATPGTPGGIGKQFNAGINHTF
jgi:predicted porin